MYRCRAAPTANSTSTKNGPEHCPSNNLNVLVQRVDSESDGYETREEVESMTKPWIIDSESIFKMGTG